MEVRKVRRTSMRIRKTEGASGKPRSVENELQQPLGLNHRHIRVDIRSTDVHERRLFAVTFQHELARIFAKNPAGNQKLKGEKPGHVERKRSAATTL